MIERRSLESLGGGNHGWLDTKHHFSFAEYHDPQRMHWGSLRVWNDDTIEGGTGFPAHPHANMEIITYVREGAITHQDSMGNKGRTEAGDVLNIGMINVEWHPVRTATISACNAVSSCCLP